MIVNRVDIFRLSNEDLWQGLKELSARERVLAADIVASVAETQRRGLHEDHGWRSLFEYCVQSLRWSEATAFRRTRAAWAVLAFPAILEMLYDGRLHIEGVVILYAFLDDTDFPGLLLKAVGKTTKEIEWLVADRRSDPVRRDVMRVVGAAAVPAVPATEVSMATLPLTSGVNEEARTPNSAQRGVPTRPAPRPRRPLRRGPRGSSGSASRRTKACTGWSCAPSS
jgi:hypothetical protein